MKLVPGKYFPAAEFVDFQLLSSRAEILVKLERLHALVLEVCPDCLMQLRNDGRLIYVPKERAHAKTRKNLLTVGIRDLGMRIMPEDGESFVDNRIQAYRTRMRRLHADLLNVPV